MIDATLDVNKMYLDEIKHFLNCIRNRKKPILGLKESEKAMKIVLKVLK